MTTIPINLRGRHTSLDIVYLEERPFLKLKGIMFGENVIILSKISEMAQVENDIIGLSM